MTGAWQGWGSRVVVAICVWCGACSGPDGPASVSTRIEDAGLDADGGPRDAGDAATGPMALPYANGGCPSALIRTSRVVSTVIFVLDGSSSMSECLDSGSVVDAGIGDPFFGGCSSRWASMRHALVEDGQILSSFDSAVRFGLIMYATPGSFDRKCPDLRTVWPALNNSETIESLIPPSTLGGGTPTHLAIRYAIDVMHRPLAPDEPTVGQTYVVLATDGLPNGCGFDSVNPRAAVLAAVKDGAKKGIKTFVMSLADEGDTHLEQVARDGEGADEPFRPGNIDELVSVMENIVGRTLGCEVILDGYVQPEHACEGTVTLNDNVLKCEGKNGWRLKESNSIELRGDACEEFKENLHAELRAEFDCNIQRPD